MKRIVELLINPDEFDEITGVDILSLVSSPAIGINWMAFSDDLVTQEFAEDIEQDILDEFISGVIKMSEEFGEELENPIIVDLDEEIESKIVNMESYSDYPDSVKNNAARGIELNEAIDNKCATLVGKQRAQQLAQGKPISFDTVKRMYSYLSRAETYYDPKDNEACGTISYLLWGGKSAKSWAESKINQVEKEKLSQNFEEEGSTAIGNAIRALGIIGRSGADKEFKTVYKYEGPLDSRTRKLCRALLIQSKTKVFTREEIKRMSTNALLSSQFIVKADSPASSYDLFKYAAGVNCRHRWVQYRMVKEGRSAVLVKTGNETKRGKDHGPYDGYTSKAAEEKSKQWYAWNFSNKFTNSLSRMDFQVDEDKQIVVGPAMTSNALIPRVTPEGEEYFVFFSKETIKEIAQKFFKNNNQNNTDINHDMEVTQDNTLLESWIVEDEEKDKSTLYGFKPNVGDWYLSYKINDDETWKKIKAGELQGYSISGAFLEKNVK